MALEGGGVKTTQVELPKVGHRRVKATAQVELPKVGHRRARVVGKLPKAGSHKRAADVEGALPRAGPSEATRLEVTLPKAGSLHRGRRAVDKGVEKANAGISKKASAPLELPKVGQRRL